MAQRLVYSGGDPASTVVEFASYKPIQGRWQFSPSSLADIPKHPLQTYSSSCDVVSSKPPCVLRCGALQRGLRAALEQHGLSPQDAARIKLPDTVHALLVQQAMHVCRTVVCHTAASGVPSVSVMNKVIFHVLGTDMELPWTPYEAAVLSAMYPASRQTSTASRPSQFLVVAPLKKWVFGGTKIEFGHLRRRELHLPYKLLQAFKPDAFDDHKYITSEALVLTLATFVFVRMLLFAAFQMRRLRVSKLTKKVLESASTNGWFGKLTFNNKRVRPVVVRSSLKRKRSS